MASCFVPPHMRGNLHKAPPEQNEKPMKGNNGIDTSLVIEDEQARSRQAQLSRLQMALGLKKELKNYSKLFGDYICCFG